MQLLFLIAITAINKLAFATHWPTPTLVMPIASPIPGESYENGYPLCKIPGFTMVPGLYNETIHQQDATLKRCRDECRSAYPACKSFAFHASYKECLFFDDVVENTQFTKDETSEFIHYDLPCHVR